VEKFVAAAFAARGFVNFFQKEFQKRFGMGIGIQGGHRCSDH
jgi:hypothetical protein